MKLNLSMTGRNAKTVTKVAGLLMVVGLGACSKETDISEVDLTDFGTRYAAAWSSQDPATFASFYAEDGRLIVNDGTPSVGRAAITETARSYMTAFPDMVVRMDSLVERDSTVRFYWRWTGTNTGPGGNGRSVDLTGYEEWTMDSSGLIDISDGHFDQDEYQRQMAD